MNALQYYSNGKLHLFHYLQIIFLRFSNDINDLVICEMTVHKCYS